MKSQNHKTHRFADTYIYLYTIEVEKNFFSLTVKYAPYALSSARPTNEIETEKQRAQNHSQQIKGDEE